MVADAGSVRWAATSLPQKKTGGASGTARF
jgi:hypothetical protein